MNQILQDQTAVVTGAGRGIGREIARELARRGARVAALARTEAEIEETAALIAAGGGQAQAIAVDLVDLAAVERALDRVEESLGPVDLLVNNHGSFRAFGPVWAVDAGEWWDDIEINLRGSFHTCRVLAPRMLARGQGRIINLVGGGTGGSFPNGSGYAASKAGLMRFTECLNDTTLSGGVRAFALDPGLVRTAMTELQLNSPAGQEWLPGIQGLFDEGVNVPPTRAAGVVAAIAEGRFDALAGRMLRGVDDLEDLAAQIPRILAEDLRSLRLTGVELPKL